MLLNNALYLAWADTKARYKKSVLGPLWLTLGSMVGVLGLALVWGTLLEENMNSFVPSLSIGLVIWFLISGVIADGSTTFVRQSAVIRNVAIPYWFFVVRALARHVINLVHNLVIILISILYFNVNIKVTAFLAIPGLLLVLANLFWITFLLGIVGARFRDLEYFISSFLPLLFFISPVVFRADRLPEKMNIIWLNPLSYFIEVIRQPLLGDIPDIKSYIVVFSVMIAGFISTYVLYRMCAHRLSFWV
ncbi:ABC transporter permease [Dickeya zeae]|uniref:ABC transporter permease n=1 Tax=Dickeya zeae TaxID=204042 RepID=UPI0014433437|nr:ABC transporter permease [Dickeya zeae]